MDLENSMVEHKINLREDLLEKMLFDENGTIWNFSKKIESRMLLFRKHKLSFSQNGSLDKTLAAALEEECDKIIGEWLNAVAKPAIKKIAKAYAPLFEKCIEEGERTFREEFIAKLTAQGNAWFTRILAENFSEIGENYAALKNAGEDTRVFETNGPFPPSMRFHWRMKNNDSVHDMFMFELPPQKKTLSFKKRNRYVALPWTCIFVGFKNGELCWYNNQHRASHCAFWCFYRPAEVKEGSNKIYFPNLPHVWNEWPYLCCLGSSAPVIKLEDPLWFEKLMGFFWQTDFRYDHVWFTCAIAGQIEEISTCEKWEQLSETNPEKILELPFRPLDKNIQQFAEGALKYLSGESKKNKTSGPSLSAKQTAILQRFGEKLAEEIYFLGGKLVVPPETESVIKKTLGDGLEKLGKHIEKHLSAQSKELAQKSMKNMIAANKGGQHVSDLD